MRQERHKPLNQIDFCPPVPELEAEVRMGGPASGHVIAGQVPGHHPAPAPARPRLLWPRGDDAALAPGANFPLISAKEKGSVI